MNRPLEQSDSSHSNEESKSGQPVDRTHLLSLEGEGIVSVLSLIRKVAPAADCRRPYSGTLKVGILQRRLCKHTQVVAVLQQCRAFLRHDSNLQFVNVEDTYHNRQIPNHAKLSSGAV